jgi:hypothetical protein
MFPAGKWAVQGLSGCRVAAVFRWSLPFVGTAAGTAMSVVGREVGKPSVRGENSLTGIFIERKTSLFFK